MQTLAIPGLWADALDRCVDELLNRSRQQPPVDAVQLARRMGLTVAWDDAQAGRGRCVRLDGRSSILLKPDPRPERLQWAAAHELGECLAWRVFDAAGVDPDDETAPSREQVANRFASHLLLPTRWFFDDARLVEGDIPELKQLYRTASHELIACRLLDFPEPSVVTVYDNGRVTRRRANARSFGTRPSLHERRLRSEAHATVRPTRSDQGHTTVQAWPIHEPGWKREIVRTTVRDWETCGTSIDS